MIRLILPQTLALIISELSAFLAVVLGILYYFNPSDPPVTPAMLMGFALTGLASFATVMFHSLRAHEFFSILEGCGFRFTKRKANDFLGSRDDGIIVKGFFYSKYILGLQDYSVTGPAGPINIKFFFPCRSGVNLYHSILKRDKRIRISRYQDSRLRKENSDAGERELMNLLKQHGEPIPVLAVSLVSNSANHVMIGTGPQSLLYRGYLSTNLPNVVRFAELIKTNLDCSQGQSTDAAVPAEMRIPAIEKEFAFTAKNS